MFLRLLPSLTNIFFPFVRRVGVLFFTSRGSGTKRRAGGQRRNAAERRMAGRESRRGECQNAFGFYFGAKAALRPRDRPSRGRTAAIRAQQSGRKTRSLPRGSLSQSKECPQLSKSLEFDCLPHLARKSVLSERDRYRIRNEKLCW